MLSILCPAGHSIDYVPCRTMSRRSTIPFVINASGRAARDIVHGCHRALRKASNLSSGRMPLLQCNVAIRINPLDKENYVQRAQRQRAVRSAQLATTGHSPARDIVDFRVPQKQLRRLEVPSAVVDQSYPCAPHGAGRKLQPVESSASAAFSEVSA